MRTKWGVALGVMALGVLALAGWMIWRPTPPAPGVLEVNGRVEGDQAAVGTKVGGQIVRLAIREGDQLEAGALLAELASDQVQAQLEQTQHALHTAQEQITAAAARVVSTQRQIDAARTAVTLAERESQAQVGAAQAALRAAQALLLAFFSIFPLQVISGTLVPVESMPRPMQLLALLSPLRYYHEIGLGIFLKGVGLESLWHQTLAMGALGVGLLALGLWQFRRRVG